MITEEILILDKLWVNSSAIFDPVPFPFQIEQKWNRIGAEIERKWNRNGTEMKRELNRNGTEIQ